MCALTTRFFLFFFLLLQGFSSYQLATCASKEPRLRTKTQSKDDMPRGLSWRGDHDGPYTRWSRFDDPCHFRRMGVLLRLGQFALTSLDAGRHEATVVGVKASGFVTLICDPISEEKIGTMSSMVWLGRLQAW